MKSPAVKKTPLANSKKTPNSSTRVTRQSKGAVAATPINLKKSPLKPGKQTRQGRGKGKLTPVEKGKKKLPKNIEVDVEEDDDEEEPTPVGKGKNELPKKNIEVDEEEDDDDDEEEEEVKSDENGRMEELDGDKAGSSDDNGDGSDDNDDGAQEDVDDEGDESSEGEEVPLPEGSVSGDSPDEDEEPSKKIPKKAGKTQSSAQEDLDNKRTVFVGNLPSSTEKKPLTKWFSRFGKVESVRFRSAPVADLKIPKKTAVITKAFHENATNINAYVKFTDETSARNALKANGEKFDDTHHIRVDSVAGPKQVDNKKAIFIGNLPFSATEDQVRELFVDCGDIESVRVVRDAKTHVAKGFGYVNFVERNSVQLACQKGEVELDGRKLRIQKSNTESREKSRKEENDDQEKPNGIYVANVPYEMLDEENLKEMFCDCGSIVSIRIPTNGPMRRLRGFAIINFAEPSAVVQALKKSGEKFKDRSLIVRIAGGGPRAVTVAPIKPSNGTVFGALQCLEELFGDIDDMTKIDLNKRGGEDSFVATVGFERPDSAKTAVRKSGETVGEATVTVTMVESQSSLKHQQKQSEKRKFEFNRNGSGGPNKRPKFDRSFEKSQNGEKSFRGVETSKEASVGKKIAKKNKKKQMTQKKKEVLKKILNADD